ncbi:pentatricopeptide repeat-containing protein At4g14190, chloroplastic [Momordica charantia]|uniref:Pentatricopeptide repeat-containing protein At4g14190, chloroplastic n=1 Tax=Momordica charantia TaxID=3673 RepID=A0A6J1DBE2_MOMCH|nr:pentatricopeptide repeat-containing protein At4g14190, chloroplastic [Momordica charantia]XP_022150399.1 pentatricopeptide repeat-containing protein At4g14190, chloroplastic [Momordica charantia]XP_022150400.1 pentatricopeptide repeat-containing protein At4g14190, chloroplastic [Momordica charantia]XP_022150401.1 pentatricopeptide repeat-containing protein At4g14190, chloroplastic [Momordica charantia]
METCVLHGYDSIGCGSKLAFRLQFPYYSSSSSYPFYLNKIRCVPSKNPTPQPLLSLTTSCAVPTHSPTKHATLLLDTFHQHHALKTLLSHLHKTDSCPLLLLTHHGDWSTDHFWVVVKFLTQASRSHQLLKLFDAWKNIERSRINESNYEKVIVLLSRDGLMDDAMSAFQDMKSIGLQPSLGIYNSLIHGFAAKGEFETAMFFVNEMKDINMTREPDTYDGLIEAYGKYRMYDEMVKCLKQMELDGCFPDQITYNLLIREFSKGGLLKKMEGLYQTMLSKRMDLQSSTLVAMLEAYTKFGILDKMEMFYRRILNSRTNLKEDLIRKLALVCIKNFMYSRLETLGVDVYIKIGKTDLVWCLRLLSHACLSSRRGMDSVVQEMDKANEIWNVTVANIILLAYLKMKDFKRLRMSFSEMRERHVKPDIVTIGILLDANNKGLNGTGTLEAWRRMNLLSRAVEMNTDSLVLAAFGKGNFLKKCEETYAALEPKDRENKIWTYEGLIDLVLEKGETGLKTR